MLSTGATNPVDTANLHRKLADAVEANWDRQTAFLAKFVQFPSLRGQEIACQDWLADEFAARGWQVDRYALADIKLEGMPGFSPVMDVDYRDAIQIVATLPDAEPDGRSLILQGHVDVVPEGPHEDWARPPFSAVIEDGWMYGRGAADMKMGCCAHIFALDAIATAGLRPRGRVHVQSVTEEEGTGNGALSTLARGYRADACLIPEPTGNHITRAHSGSLWVRLRVKAKPAHAQYAKPGDNAITAAYKLIAALQALTDRLNEEAKTNPWFRGLPAPMKFNPGKIRGGDWTSSVASWCEVECRLGVLPGTPIATARAQVEQAIASAVDNDDLLKQNPPEIIWHGMQSEGSALLPGGTAETVLATAHQAVLGVAMPEQISSGANDTRQYALYYGIQSLCYGPCGENIHAFDERADLKSVKRTTLILAQFISSWCGVVAR